MKIMIIGCGRQGSELAQALDKGDYTISVVDNDPVAFERLGHAFKGQTIHGNGLDREVLISAGIEHADGLAALTASDDLNIVVARLASQVFRVPRVVARVHDPRKAEIYRRLGVPTVTPVALGTQRFAELLTYFPLHTVKRLGTGEVTIVESDIPPFLVGRQVNELTIPGEIMVMAISRAGITEMPTPGTLFRDGDRLYLAVTSAATERLKMLMG
jgi:trk system potassium uptake protein